MKHRAGLAVLVGIVAVALTLAPGPAFAAGDQAGGSLVQQMMAAADSSLGEQAPVAVTRAYDRGHDALQILESLLDQEVRADGTITEDGSPVEPFREPSGVIAGNGAPTSAEDIALDALERGIQKSTKKFDKKHDLTARAKSAGVDDLDLFTMMMVLGAMAEGYSPEQIIVDGLMAGGMRVSFGGVGGVQIVDEHGKPIKPDGVEVTEEHEESEDLLETFVLDVLDTIGGIDPRSARDMDYVHNFAVDVTITAGDPGSSFTVTGNGGVGPPEDKRVRKANQDAVVGRARGSITASGACSIGSGGTKHPWKIDGPVVLGISGRSVGRDLQLRIAFTEVNASVTGDSGTCVDLMRDYSAGLELVSFPSVQVPARDGATGTLQTALSGDPVDVTVKLSS